ncbi:permease [Jeotgalibacillus proteolyticus]|uniref:Permease n=1 Tax=Jeotgalibacillus proteolyticus TaxID=2082395 RepID=A0A2S5G9G3_9BACL|nr:permease [Jeotgalibacillus proteolyticus]PPA69564.1 hypothetical protein C4B60_13530 [Jeotgalibacillus proteolyticus]
MSRWLYSSLVNTTGVLALIVVVYFVTYTPWLMNSVSFLLSDSFIQLNTIFLSILIEAVPFVLIGVLTAGFIQMYITEEHIRRWIPKNKYKAIIMSCLVGAVFPACECGIVPIVRRLVKKGVPLYAGVGILLTGPLINPMVILSTYMAFGNHVTMAGLRVGGGFTAALLITLSISTLFKSNQLKGPLADPVHKEAQAGTNRSFSYKARGMMQHSIDEFFDMGKYLIIGAFIAASFQTYIPVKSLYLFGDGLMYSTSVMMGLAYFLSLCSEADAFIGASFSNLFPSVSILAFLIYGPMIDLKNTIMLLSVFKIKFVTVLLLLITAIVFGSIIVTQSLFL